MRNVSLLWCVLLIVLAVPGVTQTVLTNADIVKMTKAGLADDVILNALESQPGAFDVSPTGLIELRKQGVSDAVLAALQRKSGSSALAVRTAGELVIPDGTEITVRLLRSLSSADARLDDPVKFESVEAVEIDGVTVIAKGAEARGRVLLAESKKSFGRKGKLDFSIDVVEAVDGQNISLRYSREMRGKNKAATAGVVTWLTGPFGFFVKGKDVEIPSGTEYTIYIDGDRTIRLKG